MFFTDDPKEFEPLEKDQLDAMLEIWEKEMFPKPTPPSSKISSHSETEQMLAANNLTLVKKLPAESTAPHAA